MIYGRTLGLVELVVDGSPAPPQLNWRKHLAVLVYLARSPRLRRSRDHLVALLWPDKGEAAARHSLNEAIRVIRRVAGDDSLVSQGDQIRLAAATIELDVDRLEASVTAGDWITAASLVQGEFLEGFAIPEASGFEDWLASERQHWKRVGREALVHHGQALLETGQLELALAAAREAVRLDPVADTATALLMRALALAGERPLALEEFGAYAARLHAATGAEPGLELQALARRIRDGHRHRPLPPRERESRDSRAAPLAGRDRLLGDACRLWQDARQGGATAMVVFGDAGFGKSRLLEELAARAALDGGSVAVCRAVEAERDEPWMGLGALLRGGLIEFPGVAGGPPAAHASLGRLAGEWRERFAGESGGQDMPCSQAFAEILRVAADERPVLLVSDDAQWLDRETLLAFDALLRDLGSCPIMLAVAATAHPARVELESLATRVGREVPGSVVTLEPLDPAELTDLARWWLPRFTSEELERVVRRVAADSAGIPLLASELFRAVALGLDLHRLAAWPEPSRTLDHTLPADLPVSVVAAIRVAFRRLGAPAQAILAAAAALPEPVSAERLCRATGSSLEDVTPALDELEWHRWLVADSRGYSFVARIIRDTVARDMLTEGQRRRIRTL